MFRAGEEWSFPDKRRFVKKGFERPLNEKRKASPIPFHNAFFNALFIPPAEESGDPGINSSSPLARSGREAYKIYLPTRPRSFFLFNPPDNCITSHCACPPTLSPIVGSPSFFPSLDRLHFLPVTQSVCRFNFIFLLSFLCQFSPPFSSCARRQSECPAIERKRVLFFEKLEFS